jgi:hypothetical protein
MPPEPPPPTHPSAVATPVAALVVDEQHERPKRVLEPANIVRAAGGTGRHVGRDYTGRVAARQSSTRDQSGRGYGHETARHRKRRSLRSGLGEQDARVQYVEPGPTVLRTKRTALPPRFQVSAHRVALHNRQLAPLHLCYQEALRVVRVRRDQVEVDAPLPVPFGSTRRSFWARPYSGAARLRNKSCILRAPSQQRLPGRSACTAPLAPSPGSREPTDTRQQRPSGQFTQACRMDTFCHDLGVMATRSFGTITPRSIRDLEFPGVVPTRATSRLRWRAVRFGVLGRRQ